MSSLKTYKKEFTALVKEYNEKYKAASDSEWESQIKEEYKEKINAVKEALADKNAEDIRQWVRENANHPIFMAIADRIGYDATGRKDPTLTILTPSTRNTIRFTGTEEPGFFRVSPDRENQVFLTYRGEILVIGLDPHFYHPRSLKNVVASMFYAEILMNIIREILIRYRVIYKWDSQKIHQEKTFRWD